MNWIYMLWIIFIAGVNGYLVCRFIGCFIDYKENRLFKLIAVVGLGMAGETVIFAGDAFNVCAALLLSLLLILICGRGAVEARAAALMLAFPLMTAMSYVVNNIPPYQGMLHHGIDAGSGISGLRYVYMIAAALLKAFLWTGLYYHFRKKLAKIKRYMTKGIWRYVIVIGTCSLLAIMAAIVSPPAVYANIHTGEELMWHPYNGWLIVLAAAVTNLGIIALLPIVVESVFWKQEEQKAGIREEYYRSLEEQQNKVRSLRHDMNSHFQMLQAYLTAGNTAKAVNYLENLDISPLSCGGRRFCDDSALNAMLNSRYDQLIEAGADVHFNLDIPEITGIGTMDLCTIFSNSLDNALEAVRKLQKAEDRRVTLKARYEKGYFSYKLTNSKCNEVLVKNGNYISDKGGRNHGYGIENIKDILQKYDGNMFIEITEEEFILFVYINE